MHVVQLSAVMLLVLLAVSQGMQSNATDQCHAAGVAIEAQFLGRSALAPGSHQPTSQQLCQDDVAGRLGMIQQPAHAVGMAAVRSPQLTSAAPIQ